MCGRYSLTAGLDRLLPRLNGHLPAGLAEHYAPRALIRPGEPLLIQRQEQGRPAVALALWGLLPSWVKDPASAHRPINARSETVGEKPSFRGPWRHHRCLLPADAFFEKGRTIRRRDGGLFWLAGLWERWIGPDGSELDTCCVLTTRPNALIAPLHERMPVLIPDGLEPPWLAPADGPGLRALEPLLEPWDPTGWEVVDPPGKPAPAAQRPDRPGEAGEGRQLALFPLDR
ncbi:MAG: SOS response-associated peptidase [Cyanobacteriota bacterium]